ncbi:MAG: ferritin-like domain-containing protein [Chloroflexi bacterium]|nr:ferritin-like domain-containing protein [Chloroflexota bacterium]
MKALSKEQIIEALNHDLIAELSAVEMYEAHAKVIPADVIVQGVRAILSVEEGHAQELTKRIEELGGEPALPGGVATIAGRAVGAASAQARTVEMLKLELGEEQQAIKDYSAQIADIVDDEDTVRLLEKHLQDEMEHARWLKAQIPAQEERG